MAVFEDVRDVVVEQLSVSPDQVKLDSKIIEDLGADKVKTLVFLKKFFDDESFAVTKERAQNLLLCVFSGIEELALPLQDKLASLGVKFYAREITFSELIARHG